ncbi:MAG: hypothetical protein HY071_04855 [Chloroflexi bacterium]|nr:hypothetical protein [Chloroflexota bacterium]
MAVRAALPTDLRRAVAFFDQALAHPDSIVGSVLPAPLVAGAVAGWTTLIPSVIGLRSRVRLYLEEHRDRLRAAALVYSGSRPEWVVLMLAGLPDPEGHDAAFRLLSFVSMRAAHHGQLRLFGAVPDESRARETFFQAGFYSYTRETWYFAPQAALPEPDRAVEGHVARGRDAHDMFRFYVMTTPHSVQRAEQLTVEDFDVGRRAGAFDPPHLIGGNPLAMKRQATMLVTDNGRPRAFAVSFRGTERHPHVCKVRIAEGDVDLARQLIRGATIDLPLGRPVTAPVRSYEDHVARALLAEGFGEASTSMLFVKELAVRIEEPALAPAAVR